MYINDNGEALVNMLNNLLLDAVTHGGDPGGPYCICFNDVVESSNALLEHLGLTEDYEIIEVDNIEHRGAIYCPMPQIVKK